MQDFLIIHSKNFPDLLSSEFLHAFSFDLLMLFPNIQTIYK